MNNKDIREMTDAELAAQVADLAKLKVLGEEAWRRIDTFPSHRADRRTDGGDAVLAPYAVERIILGAARRKGEGRHNVTGVADPGERNAERGKKDRIAKQNDRRCLIPFHALPPFLLV